MKKIKRPRSAFVLFMKGTPFKPKIVKDKTKYTRKTKHKRDER